MRNGDESRGVRRGFTLVELLVVIGIIAVLISMLMPALNKARQSAYAVQCASNMRQLGQGFLMYAGEYKGVLPSPRDWTWIPVNSDYAGADSVFFNRFMSGNKQVYHCPMGPTDRNTTDVISAYDHILSYVENAWMDYKGFVSFGTWTKAQMGVRARVSYWRRASSTALLAEGYRVNATWFDPIGSGPDRWLPSRHSKGGNVLFLDGHVSQFTQAQWNPRIGRLVANGNDY